MKNQITITRRDSGGLTVAIGFVLFWFGEECERAIRRERGR